MYPQETVHHVAIIGTGTIGASWATHYLARGFHVTAIDPASQAEEALRSSIAVAWDTATKLGLSAAASPDRLRDGRGGIEYFMNHLMPLVAKTLWSDLGSPELTPELQETIVNGIPGGGRRPFDRRAGRPTRRDTVRSAECAGPARSIRLVGRNGQTARHRLSAREDPPGPDLPGLFSVHPNSYESHALTGQANQQDGGSPVDYQRSRWSTWSRGSRGAGRNVSPV